MTDLTNILNRVSREFNTSKVTLYFYCDKVGYYEIKERIHQRFGSEVCIMFRVNHIVVRDVEGHLNLFVLSDHGRCATFLH